MGKLQEIITKYGNCNDREQRKILREQLKSVKSEDLTSIEDHKSYIEILRKFRFSLAEDAKLNGDNFSALLESLLSVGEDGVYLSPLRFLFELIQNVDDCDYEDPTQVELDIHTAWNEGKIILTYNEKGFTPFNVFAITGIAEAAKNISESKVEIGEKGIGFKSVFGVASKVLIQSGKFSFELNKHDFTIPEPKYDNFEEIKGTRLTLTVEPSKVQQIFYDFNNTYKDSNAVLNANPVLFLNKLTKLRVYFDSWRSLTFEVSRKRLPNTDEMSVEDDVLLSVEYAKQSLESPAPRKEIRCLRYNMPITYSPPAYKSRYNKSIEKSKRMWMQVIVPQVDEVKKDEKNQITEGRLYSFLPTQIKMTVPVACHIPFKLDASREFVDPQDNNEWFRQSSKEFLKFLENVYIDLARKYKEKVIYYLPNKSAYLFVNGNCLQTEEFKRVSLFNLPIFYTVNKQFVTANEVFVFSQDEKLVEQEKLYRLLGLKNELFLLPENAKNPGLVVEKNVYSRLFKIALNNAKLTKQIMEILATVEDFPFKKEIEGNEQVNFTVEQVLSLQTCPACFDAFQNYSRSRIRARMRPIFQIASQGLVVEDVRRIESIDEPLLESDFDEKAALFFKLIGYKCVYVNGASEKFWFAAHNIILLGSGSKLSSLSEFCGKVDDNCLIAINIAYNLYAKTLEDAFDISPTKYINLLYKYRKGFKKILGDERYKRLLELINNSGVDSERYINELLQNADDCEYVDRPVFTLNVGKDNRTITTWYNETGFTNKNVYAITDIGQSTKKQILSGHETAEIGEKGVGFKSVFSVASNVVIHSGKFHFTLDAQTPTIPNLLEETELDDVQGTKMVFTMKSAVKSDFFTEEKVLKLCLCLRKLKNIRLGTFNVKISDDNQIRKIEINGKEYFFRILNYGFEVNDNVLLAERENNQRKIDNKQRIRFYIPQNNKAGIKYALYCGLPTKIEANIPLVIDAPFELTTSREDIVKNKWNEHIKEKLYDAYISLVKELKDNEGIKVLRFLPFRKDNERLTLRLFTGLNLEIERLISALKKEPFIETYKVNYYANPNTMGLVRVPDVVRYLLDDGQNIGYLTQNIVKCNGISEYIPAMEALGIRLMSIDETIKVLQKCYADNIEDDNFRKYLYAYLEQYCSKFTNTNREAIKTMDIIPVKGRSINEIKFVSWKNFQGKIYTKEGENVSPDYGWLLQTSELKKEVCERTLGISINELNSDYENMIYQKALRDKILSASDEDIYLFLMREFATNRSKLNQCIDVLIANAERIPLKNEKGKLVKGKIYISNEESDYFLGELLPSHIVHKECKALAQFIRRYDIADVYYENLRVQKPLTADDIESIQDTYIKHTFEILESCYKDGWIDEKLAKEYDIGGKNLSHAIYEDANEDVFNQPVKNKNALIGKIESAMRNPIRIVPKKVERTVHFGVTQTDEFPINSHEKRKDILHRYQDKPGQCVCQRCKKSFDVKFIEVNSIEKMPPYFWAQMGVALCLNCSKHFEELRENSVVLDKFHDAIQKANVMTDEAIEIPIGNEEIITFSQTHLAEIQEIMKRQPK